MAAPPSSFSALLTLVRSVLAVFADLLMNFKLSGIAFPRIAELWWPQSSAACITNTGWKRLY